MRKVCPRGKVLEALPDLRFRVEMDDGKEVLCYLGGKMKTRQIGVSVGDTVEVMLDPYGGKATNRIVWRL